MKSEGIYEFLGLEGGCGETQARRAAQVVNHGPRAAPSVRALRQSGE